MNRLLVLAPLALCAAMCAKKEATTTPASPPSPAPDGFTLVVTDAVVGNLEPCGCSPDQRGGVARAAAAVQTIRQEGRPVLLVDGGDRFFPGSAPPADPLVANSQSLQARTMAEVTEAMHYDALVLGARDAGTPGFFEKTKLPPILDAGEPQPFTKPFLVKEIAGHKVGLFAAGASEEPEKTIASRAAALKSQGADVLVLFAYRTFEEAKKLLPAAKDAGVSMVFATRSDVPEVQESGALTDSVPPLFTVAARGEAILRVDVSLGGPPGAPLHKVSGAAEREETLAAMQQRIDLLRGEVKDSNPLDPATKMKEQKLLELEGRRAKLAASAPPPLPKNENAFTYAFVPMSPTLAKEPSAAAMVEAFHKASADESLAWVKAHPRECPRPRPGEQSFAGISACEDCHDEAVAFWKTTPHAKAYQALVDRGRQYDVACIGCHVTGYEKPGGACSIAMTEGRQNVQCEACHGAASGHVESGGDEKLVSREVPVTTCRRCHDPENSPHFNDKTYRPQILGPGHGQPLAKTEPQKR